MPPTVDSGLMTTPLVPTMTPITMLMEEMPKVWLQFRGERDQGRHNDSIPLETAPISPPSTIMIGWAVLAYDVLKTVR